ncbi:SGNH/GDSL hydrolase family protein [bacterium]|nr:SGNH/GDSL hydrolase family protein [bacterium]
MKRVLSRTFLVLFGIALTLGLLEAALRVLGLFPPPSPDRPAERTPYGWRMAPNIRTLNRDLHGEYSHMIQSNAHGMNEDDVTIEKPAGTRRIAFFGDSYTEAFQVRREENFAERVERLLGSLGSGRIQTLNFGMSGYGPDLCYLRYLHQGREFSPDIVVLVDLVENDAHDVTPEAYPRWQKSVYDVDADTWIPAEPVPPGVTLGVDPRSHRWYRRSHVYTMKREAAVRWRTWFRERFGKVGKTELPFHWRMMLTPPDAYWEKAWQTTERIIERFKTDVERNGAAFVIVIMPSRFEIHPEYWAAVEKRHHVPENIDLSFPRKQIRRIAERLNLNTIDLYDAMKAAGQTQTLYFRHDGHLTTAGHKVVAEEISKQWAEKIKPLN